MVIIYLATGFEETEAVVPYDLLRRAGIDVRYASVGDKAVTGSHGITILADMEGKDVHDAQMLVLPGGLKGVKNLLSSDEALRLVREVHAGGGWIAAICAAPTVLASLGITDGLQATCYPGMEKQMGRAQVCSRPVVTDGRLITGRAAGSSMAFGLELVKALKGEAAARELAADLVYHME